MSARHLIGRFFGSLAPRRLSEEEAVWVASHLTPEEADLWARMGKADRRHAVVVGRRVAAALDGTDQATQPVMAAALLHDVGKVASGLGVYGRVMATLSAKVAGRDMAEAWSQTRGMTRKIGLYLHHEALGADLLRLAGSDPETIDLVATWSTPTTDVGRTLKAADDL